MKNKIEYALSFAKKAHKNQTRKYSNLNYFDNHIIPVYELLQYEKEDVIIGGILHDVVEDTHVTLENIYYTFGTTIRDLVYNMTKTYSESDSSDEKSQSEYNRWSVINNDDAKLIKVADILANLRDDNNDDTPESFRKKFRAGKKKLLPLLEINHKLYKELVLELKG